MASEITIKGKKTNKGERMTKGTGWRLAKITGRKRVFVGTLLGNHQHRNQPDRDL